MIPESAMAKIPHRYVYFTLGVLASVVAVANTGNQTAPAITSAGFAIAAGLCFVAAAITTPRRPNE